MSRVEAASGAQYTAQKEAPRKFEPIAPVGTNYVPIGKPDLAALRREAAAPTHQAQPPPPPAAARPVPAAPRSVFPTPAASFRSIPTVNRASAPDDAWGEPPAPSKPPPPPAAAARPPVISAARPTPSPAVSCDYPLAKVLV